MNEMVERVRDVVCGLMACDMGAHPGRYCGDTRRACTEVARAAIAATRYPACDAAMMDAGMKAVIFGGSPDSVAWNVFHVMIDAALAGAAEPRPSPGTGSTER